MCGSTVIQLLLARFLKAGDPCRLHPPPLWGLRYLTTPREQSHRPGRIPTCSRCVHNCNTAHQHMCTLYVGFFGLIWEVCDNYQSYLLAGVIFGLLIFSRQLNIHYIRTLYVSGIHALCMYTSIYMFRGAGNVNRPAANNYATDSNVIFLVFWVRET